MASSKLKIEKKNKLYFNKYKYKATVRLEGANLTYYTVDLETFNAKFEKLKTSYKNQPNAFYNEWHYENVNIDKIAKYLSWRNLFKDRVTLRVNFNSVSVFSNDLTILKSLDSIDEVSLCEAKVLQSDVMYFKKQPKFKYRTYFRAKRVPKDFIENVDSFIKNYKDKNLHISSSLQRFLTERNWHPYIYLHGSYHIDYNDESFLSILHMYFTGMIAQTYKLDKEPKNV